ncbi:hypothetical protein VNI00_004632 [Paramarasmius palmivorus]|uniref:FAD-binding PCMH-type domain-containing protein n=1 Tax=Paramarasmius palmivorus TaxID=297713 RepID=A0AAW0DJF7_9AGAR
MENPNFQAFISSNGTISACYLDTSLGAPCEQGSIPPVGVDARSVGDIQAAVRFAAKHNLRLVIKNTGHDYLGRSAAPDSFMIWTHNLKNLVYDEAFIPANSNSTETFKGEYLPLTFEAGIQWREAYAAADQHGRVIPGGFSPGVNLEAGGSVGAAGGWILGGGHSALSPTYGLGRLLPGVDNVLQFTVVAASGEVLTANAFTNPDLFWALRGGGGGTFGVVTSVTYRTHERTPVGAALLQSDFSSPAVAKQVTSEFLRIIPSLADSGWGGYSRFSNESFSAILMAPNATLADANATFASFNDLLQSTSNGSVTTTTYDSFLKWYQDRSVGYSIVGVNVELASRLFGRKVHETEHDKMAEVLLSIDGGFDFNHVAGGMVSRIDPDSVGVTPTWRDAVAHLYVTVTWRDGATATEIRDLQKKLQGYNDLLADLDPGAGTYLNEASLYERNFQQAFFGNHYDRLSAIKDQYDPTHLFVVPKGVGSERWDESLNCPSDSKRVEYGPLVR